MNTRRYPRTTLEAFGVDARTACAIERPSPSESIAGVLLAVVIGLALVAAIYKWADEPPVNESPKVEKLCGENAVEIDGKCFMKNGKRVRT